MKCVFRLATLVLVLSAWSWSTVAGESASVGHAASHGASAQQGPSSPGPHIDPARLIAEARRVQQKDLAAWGRSSFRRQVFRERLDERDTVTSTEVLDFLITPLGQGRFDETLQKIDGRLAGRSEVREHRRAKRFEKRYRTAFVGEAADYGKGDFSLAHFMTRSNYRYGGIEKVAGLRCHRLDFAAEPKARGRQGVAEQLSSGTAGTLWLDAEGLHIVRAESRLERPISAMMGLVDIERVIIQLTTLPFAGHRMPKEIAVTTTSTLAGRRQIKRNRFLYQEHRMAGPSGGTGGP